LPLDVADLYPRMGPMVFRRCRRLLGEEAAAMDATQDVFVQVLVHQDRLNAAAPASLLLQIATNVCLNRLRTRARHPETSADELLARIATAGEIDGRTAARSVLARLFDRNEASSQTIAVMHLLDGLTLEEVAREVGMSVSGVRKRLRKLRAQVRELEGV
jgi:RNA polymerase sigma factor (sigma-70 family)